jgi:nicotinamide riboside transporter PnuC
VTAYLAGDTTDPSMNWIEAVAVGFGACSVALTIRQSLWCWPAGLVQVALYVHAFYAARLYSDIFEPRRAVAERLKDRPR